jgi:NAD(P)-dependent dehydrogenase (short-subunit alcohol dehydrogenase family)
MATDDKTGLCPVWFITGTSSGVGQATAIAALDRGDLVVATARNPEALRGLVSHDRDRVLPIRLDVRDEDEARSAVAGAVAAFGRIDVVVNSAGYGLFGPVEKTTDAQARAIFDTNFFGVLNVLRAALPVLRTQRAGHVFQLSSLFGQMSWPGTGLLAATKHAVGGITAALAQELAPLGIRFTMIEPAAISNTRFMSNSIATETESDYDGTVGALLRSLTQAPPSDVSATTVAAAIARIASADRPPLHLALGRTAAEAIHNELTARLQDLTEWEQLPDMNQTARDSEPRDLNGTRLLEDPDLAYAGAAPPPSARC